MKRAQLVTLGCARNDTDSEELAARLEAGGWSVTADEVSAGEGDVVLVNTCGFIAAAKKDSVDALLEAADSGATVVAVGCMAERYGEELARELPEAAAVLGFDHYPTLAEDLDRLVAGERIASHTPKDRRTRLPLVATARATAATGLVANEVSVPVPGGSRVVRRRLDHSVVAPLKIASGCDRRCAFCAIPRFRGSFVSRDPDEITAEAQWLVASGVREIVLVSENSTSYGKDLGELRALESLLTRLSETEGLLRVRPVYLQPAEVRPGLIDVITGTPGVARYADLSFQHASPTLLRRMRRFGGTEKFLQLLDEFRVRAPQLGARSNVIVGFPGETEVDVDELARFLTEARLDAVGVFAYSDEEDTEAATLDHALPPEVIAERFERISQLAEQLTAQRAAERIGETVDVLIEEVTGGLAHGRGEHQQPDVDGACVVRGEGLRVGEMVRCRVVATEGVDLVCEATWGEGYDPARPLAGSVSA